MEDMKHFDVIINTELLIEILKRLESFKEYAALDCPNGAGSARNCFGGTSDDVIPDGDTAALMAEYVDETNDFLQCLDAGILWAVGREIYRADCGAGVLPNGNPPQIHPPKITRFH